MRLARKLQLAYLTLLFIPVLIIGSLVLVTYYLGTNTLGPYKDLEAPGWLKPELAAIMEADWVRYGELREHTVIFVMNQDGYLHFPTVTDKGIVPEDYPDIYSVEPEQIFDGQPNEGPNPHRNPMTYFPEMISRFGTEWTLDLSITPISVDSVPYMVGWRSPRHGIAGFMTRRGWLVPLFVLTGVLLIPAFIDARLRRSVKRLQDAAGRLSNGRLDEPITASRRDDLSELAVSLETTRLELKDSRDRKGRFLMAVSHDLRTPLTSIKGYIEALGDGLAETPEEFSRYLTVLEEKTGLLENRIGELIDFARAETGGWKRPTGEVNALALISRLDASFRSDAGFSGRNYDSNIDVPGEILIDGDKDALYRAWENLFANAVQHTEEGELIRFRAGLDDSTGSLFGEVIDGGYGVDIDFVPLMFEPFTRADRGRNIEGLGLGLASVKAVAEAHRGSVEYSPAPGGGSILRITIPCRTSLRG